MTFAFDSFVGLMVATAIASVFDYQVGQSAIVFFHQELLSSSVRSLDQCPVDGYRLTPCYIKLKKHNWCNLGVLLGYHLSDSQGMIDVMLGKPQ